MKIRSLTYFIDPASKLEEQIIQASQHADETKRNLGAIQIEVQTTRIATTPFPRWLDLSHAGRVVSNLHELEQRTSAAGFDYTAIGPALPDRQESYTVIPTILGETRLFASGLMNHGNMLFLAAVRKCAEIIRALGVVTPDGFTNLRFAALGNVPAGSPFFPSAYADPENLGLGIAIEGADLAVDIFSNAKSIAEAQTSLAARITHITAQIIENLPEGNPLKLVGIDFTLAPYPQDAISIGYALECLGIPALGQAGSATAAAILLSAMSMAEYPRTGFNGLMMPVLEDSRLARRAGEGLLGLQDLLLYSTICGTGLDTIPLPGETTTGQLYAILMDIGALSLRLNKPLTARLMPIPGKTAGDPTSFDFSYFSNSQVMEVDAQDLTGLLAAASPFQISPRD